MVLISQLTDQVVKLKGVNSYLNSTSSETPIQTCIRFLRDIYNCHLDETVQDTIEDSVTGKLGGSSWAGYRHCRRAHHKPACIPEIRRSCLKSKIRVTKVLRLQLDAVEPLLEDDKSLKVVQVFRDPRGIMCSRTVKTWWYALRINNGYSPIKVNARLLCNKMLKDFKAGKELMKRFPNRVKFIRYEDLVCRNRKTVVKELYEFLKLERRSNKIQVTTSGFKWKQLLDKEDIEKIDDVCSDVYNALGFHKLSEQKNFENEYSSFISDFDINK